MTTAELEFHPLANLFPLIEGKEFQDLVDDVGRYGVIEPVELLDDKILDGRNRYRAWLASGGTAEISFKTYEGSDPVAYVVSKNLRRRHLDESQRAMIAAELPRVAFGDVEESPDNALTREERAALLNVSVRSVDRAQDVRDKGAPELVDAVRAGDVSVSAAAGLTALPKEQQAKIITELAKDEAGHLTPEAKATIKELSKEIRAKEQAEKKERRARREADLAANIAALPTKRYGVIYADPEWRFEPFSRDSGMDRAADNHYPTSATEMIARRPVADIAADDCVLFLWATVPMLCDALEVLRAWGFEYKSSYAWIKARPVLVDGVPEIKLNLGTGYWSRNAHECLLIGTRGNVPAPAMGTQWPSVFFAEVGEHSEKPEVATEMIEAYFPNLPKIELNRRGPARPGWDAWGNEAEPSLWSAAEQTAEQHVDRVEDVAEPAGDAEPPAAVEIAPAELPDGIDRSRAEDVPFTVVQAAPSPPPPPADQDLEMPAFLRRRK